MLSCLECTPFSYEPKETNMNLSTIRPPPQPLLEKKLSLVGTPLPGKIFWIRACIRSVVKVCFNLYRPSYLYLKRGPARHPLLIKIHYFLITFYVTYSFNILNSGDCKNNLPGPTGIICLVFSESSLHALLDWTLCQLSYYSDDQNKNKFSLIFFSELPTLLGVSGIFS